MGRRKGQIAQMGNSLLVKDKHKKHQGHRGNYDTFLHTTDLGDGVNYNRINFQSVTEQSHLEDFLTTAEMAGKDFTAERQNISFVTGPSQGIRLTRDDMTMISKAQEEHKALLRIPRRPFWDENTTKQDLLLKEKDTFTDWRRQLNALQEKDHIELTPYEKNLDFWRQLWRVIERSDVIVQIVDARNPMLFRCEDLETYIKEIDAKKTSMLLINKADYLTERQRCQWVDYLNQEKITGVFFSAKMEKESLESDVDAEHTSKMEEDSDEDATSTSDESEGYDSDIESSVVDGEKVNSEDQILDNRESKDDPSLSENLTSQDTSADMIAIQSLNVNSPCGNESSNVPESHADLSESPGSFASPSSSNADTKLDTNVTLIENCAKIVSSEELLDIFVKLAHPSASSLRKEVKTVGMVGYPNVGKSSTINAILQKKQLAVSATPGRTKHLQTLYVDDHLMLCDCPGLVFPSFVATKAHLVVNGILPIDELRDHISPTNLICDYIPRNVLEATYSIMIPRPSVDDVNPNRPPTAEELLNAYGGMRGFMSQRGVPDGPRASRYILKDFVKGKLLYCNPPPLISGPEFQDQERIEKLEAAKPITKIAPPQIKSSVDKEFFEKKNTKAGTRGVRGVSDFIRVDKQQQSNRTTGDGQMDVDGEGSSMGSCLSINSRAVEGKPWKKHNNHHKKEKLRRLHRDLDI